LYQPSTSMTMSMAEYTFIAAAAPVNIQ
jgi:hypothetical protein